MVLTRSQSKALEATRTEYEVSIDFDYASTCWNANKKKIGQGGYKYICGHVLKNGKRCQRHPSCPLHK